MDFCVECVVFAFKISSKLMLIIYSNIKTMREQLLKTGIIFDWDRVRFIL